MPQREAYENSILGMPEAGSAAIGLQGSIRFDPFTQ
jgi:hypothetical protein